MASEERRAHGIVGFDADREAGLRIHLRQLVEDRLRHGWGELLRAKAVPAADDQFGEDRWCQVLRAEPYLRQHGHHVLQERFAYSAWLLCSVQDRNLTHGRR